MCLDWPHNRARNPCRYWVRRPVFLRPPSRIIHADDRIWPRRSPYDLRVNALVSAHCVRRFLTLHIIAQHGLTIA
jgi:hypothetical protein